MLSLVNIEHNQVGQSKIGTHRQGKWNNPWRPRPRQTYPLNNLCNCWQVLRRAHWFLNISPMHTVCKHLDPLPVGTVHRNTPCTLCFPLQLQTCQHRTRRSRWFVQWCWRIFLQNICSTSQQNHSPQLKYFRKYQHRTRRRRGNQELVGGFLGDMVHTCWLQCGCHRKPHDVQLDNPNRRPRCCCSWPKFFRHRIFDKFQHHDNNRSDRAVVCKKTCGGGVEKIEYVNSNRGRYSNEKKKC